MVVTDKSGVPVPGLTQQEFTVTDNGQMRPIVSFHAYAATAAHADGPPVETIILLDTLNMTVLEVAQARTAIDHYLRQNGGHLAGPTSVFIFSEDGIKGQTNPTTDGNALAESVAQLATRNRSIGRSAAGWGASERYNMSLKAMGMIVANEAKRPARKLLLWVGPGWPLMDGPNRMLSPKDKDNIFSVLMNVSRELREAQIAVYSVSIGNPDMSSTSYHGFLKGVASPKDALPSDLNTKVLAVESGGLVLGPDQDLARQIGICQQDASAYYTITFDPTRPDRRDEFHEIQVQTDKGWLKVRTTTGYYAEP
jgi:VWFA-related protein